MAVAMSCSARVRSWLAVSFPFADGLVFEAAVVGFAIGVSWLTEPWLPAVEGADRLSAFAGAGGLADLEAGGGGLGLALAADLVDEEPDEDEREVVFPDIRIAPCKYLY